MCICSVSIRNHEPYISTKYVITNILSSLQRWSQHFLHHHVIVQHLHLSLLYDDIEAQCCTTSPYILTFTLHIWLHMSSSSYSTHWPTLVWLQTHKFVGGNGRRCYSKLYAINHEFVNKSDSYIVTLDGISLASRTAVRNLFLTSICHLTHI